jgi:hypothetical protein
MTVQRARRHHLRDGALPAVRRLDVIEHRASGATEGNPDPPVDRVGADVERDHHARFLGRGPERLPAVAVVVVLALRRRRRKEDGLRPHPGQALQLGHGVVDVEHRHLRRDDEAWRHALNLRHGPVVAHAHRLTEQRGIVERAVPHAERREDELAQTPSLSRSVRRALASRAPGGRWLAS